MLKIRIQGTKRDIKSFQKWLKKSLKVIEKYELRNESELYLNSGTDMYYRWYAELFTPLDNEIGGKAYVQSNCYTKSKRGSGKNRDHNPVRSRTRKEWEKGIDY